MTNTVNLKMLFFCPVYIFGFFKKKIRCLYICGIEVFIYDKNLNSHQILGETSTRHDLPHQIKLPVPKMGNILLFAKGVPWKPHCQTLQATAKVIGCSLQPDGKGLLLKATFTNDIDHGEGELCLLRNFMATD